MRSSTLLAVVLVVLVSAVGSAGAALDADADADPQSDEPVAQTETNSTATSTAESDSGEVVARVDSRLDVVAKRYDAQNQTFYVTLRNRDDGRDGSESQVTLTELVDRSEHGGSARFGIRRLSVEPGETVEVGVFARRVDGRAGVMVVSEESVESGEGRLVQEPPRGVDVVEGRSTWGDVRAAGAGALVSAVLVVVLGAWQVVASRHEEFEPVDLDGGSK